MASVHFALKHPRKVSLRDKLSLRAFLPFSCDYFDSASSWSVVRFCNFRGWCIVELHVRLAFVGLAMTWKCSVCSREKMFKLQRLFWCASRRRTRFFMGKDWRLRIKNKMLYSISPLKVSEQHQSHLQDIEIAYKANQSRSKTCPRSTFFNDANKS